MKMRKPNSFAAMPFAKSVCCGQGLVCVLAALSFLALPGLAQNQPVRVIAFGAHPDDCDLGAGGLAAKYAAHGDKVKFVSITNGDAGHQSMSGEALDKRRRAEAMEAGRRIGIEYEVLEKKVNMLDAHVSQFYEWLPWPEGQLEQVPKDPAERKKWLAAGPLASRKLQPKWREALQKRYGAHADQIQHVEAFEITEYGH